jgi:hypothetical protein
MTYFRPSNTVCCYPGCKAPRTQGVERLTMWGDRWSVPIWYCEKHADLVVTNHPTTARRYESGVKP